MNKLLIMACAAAAIAAASKASAADAYISSTTNGTVYAINTGYKIGASTAIFVDFEFLARSIDVGKTHQQFVFNATGDNGQARIYLTGSEGKGSIAWTFTDSGANNAQFVSTSVTMVPGTRYRMKIDGVARKTTLLLRQ